MADLTILEDQIKNLETQKANTETLFIKIQGALEALAALKEQVIAAEKTEPAVKKEKINKK